MNVALSKPSFELWLLLHHVEESALGSLLSRERTSRRHCAVRLGQYNKTNLKPEHYPLASVSSACERAWRLDATVEGGDIPRQNTTRVWASGKPSPPRRRRCNSLLNSAAC